MYPQVAFLCFNRTRESTALPIRRLWCYLVRQEKVQDIFIRLVFGKKHIHSHSLGGNNVDSASVYSDPTGQGICLEENHSIVTRLKSYFRISSSYR